MKIFDRISVILINLSIIAVFIIAPALILASSESYYSRQFEKNGIYASADGGAEVRTRIYFIGGNVGSYAEFSDGQLDMLSEHIIDYLFGDGESFALTMDGVLLCGELTDGVGIFGETAVLHMADVKLLMQTAKVIAIILGVLLIPLIGYVIYRRRSIGGIAVRYTAFFFIGVLALIALFLAVTFFSDLEFLSNNPDYFPDAIWTNMHYLLFPFRPDKFENSFFNDTLTQILTLELFLDAVVTVLAVLGAALAAWLALAFWIRSLSAKKNK